MALYQLPKQTLTQLRLNVKGGAGQSVNSVLPLIFHNFLERLANPSPTFHMLRSPFLRPLLNKQASKLPIYHLLSPAHTPSPDDLSPDSPLQKELIEFFQEKQMHLINGISVEENMPVYVYCMHRKRILGPPQLVISEGYNDAISRAGKHAGTMHAISVLSHQFSLMLQAEADSDFRVTTSRRPSDIDMSQEFNAYVRASFADFQLEKRGNVWQLVGALQPTPLQLEGPAPAAPADEAALFFKPRALSQEKTSQWCTVWEKDVWDLRADLAFFTKDTTIPWEGIDDTRVKTFNGPDGPVKVRATTRSRRTISFAPPMTAWELSADHSSALRRRISDPLGEEEEYLLQEDTVQPKQTDWMERLSAKDLGSPDAGSGWSSPHPWVVPVQGRAPWKQKRVAPVTGANYTPLASRRGSLSSKSSNLPISKVAKASIAEDTTRRPVPTKPKQGAVEVATGNKPPARVSAPRPSPQFSRDAAPHEEKQLKDQ